MVLCRRLTAATLTYTVTHYIGITDYVPTDRKTDRQRLTDLTVRQGPCERRHTPSLPPPRPKYSSSRATQPVVWRVRRGGRLRFSVHASNRRPSSNPPSAFGSCGRASYLRLGRPTACCTNRSWNLNSHFQGYFGPFCTTRSHRRDCVALTLTCPGSRPRNLGT